MKSFKTFQYGVEKDFALDNRGIYYKGTLIARDTTGFKVVGEVNGHKFWKNKYQVFDHERLLREVDPTTFATIEFFNSSYLKDKNSVYYLDKKIKGSDAASIINQHSGPAYDKNYIYDKDSLLKYHEEILKSVNGIFGKTDGQVISLAKMKPMKHIDSKSLIGLSPSYSADRYHIFYDTIAFAATPANGNKLRAWEQVNSHFISDGLHIYCCEYLCDELDAGTFSMLPESDICYDKNGIYYHIWNEVKKQVTFKKLPFTFNVPVTDSNVCLSRNGRFIIYTDQVYDYSLNKVITGLSQQELQKVKSMRDYFRKIPLSELLHENIRYLYNGVIVRGDQAFYHDTLLKKINGRELSYLGGRYYKYKKQVYYLILDSFQPILSADIASFKTNQSFTYDKNHVYRGPNIILASKNIELLAVLAGPRHGGDEGWYAVDYYLYKNDKGYWVLSSNESKPNYLASPLPKRLSNSLRNLK